MNNSKQNKQLTMLAAVSVGMFGFAFALVPLYDVFCEVTGLNGKTATSEFVVTAPLVQSERMVTIQFLAKVGRGLPWEVYPVETAMQVRVGQIYTANFHARNRASRRVSGQAIPSVSPGQAAAHLKKIECFCFETQTLAAGAEMDMPVRFLVASDLPDDISTLSLSYTLFPVSVAAVDHGTQRTSVRSNNDESLQELRL
jgi:cytochrome c oxidase assembly protein subunit 11